MFKNLSYMGCKLPLLSVQLQDLIRERSNLIKRSTVC